MEKIFRCSTCVGKATTYFQNTVKPSFSSACLIHSKATSYKSLILFVCLICCGRSKVRQPFIWPSDWWTEPPFT